MNAISNFYYAVSQFLAEASETIGVGIHAGMEAWRTELAIAHHDRDDDDDSPKEYTYKARPTLRVEADGVYCAKCNNKCYNADRCTWCD
jgi:hypothetical protein